MSRMTEGDIQDMARRYSEAEPETVKVGDLDVDGRTLIDWFVQDGQAILPYLENAKSWDGEQVLGETSLAKYVKEKTETRDVNLLTVYRLIAQMGITFYREKVGILAFVPGDNSINITPGYVLFPMPKEE